MRDRLVTLNAHQETESALLEGIARGERAYAEGRVATHDEALAQLDKWLTQTESSSEHDNVRSKS